MDSDPRYWSRNTDIRMESMTTETTIRRIGNSAGLIIPEKMLQRYNLSVGDRVHLVETERGLLITLFDPDLEEAMTLYEEGASDYRKALREFG